MKLSQLNIVLVEPQIPQNTGNISRTCAVTGARLHLVEPLGFTVTDKHLKRAGLDYWDKLDLTYYTNWEDFCDKNPEGERYLFTGKGRHIHSDVSYPTDKPVYLVFGREDKGLNESLLVQHPDTCVRIPMRNTLRSLNLSNSVAIVLYESLRQNNFMEAERNGQLHRLHWHSEQ